MTSDPPSSGLVDEAVRELSAARAELRGRADQAALDYEERLGLIAGLATAVTSGELSPRVARDRARQLLSDGPVSARPPKLGRTHVGLRPGSVPPSPAAGVPRPGASPALVAAALAKAQADLDARVVAVLTLPAIRRPEARLELGLLSRLRRSIDLVAVDLPTEAVLLETVLEFADDVQRTVADLKSGAETRVGRFLDYLRTLVGQLQAVGASVDEARERVRRARATLEEGSGDVERMAAEAAALFGRLFPEWGRCLPGPERTLLDEIVGS